MSKYTIMLATSRPAAAVHSALSRFDGFPLYATDIRSVTRNGGTSQWTACFRGGVVRWRQRDVLDDPARITFTQVDGDFAELSGEWAIEQRESGSEVTCTVTVRTSVPHLAGAIDPMIARVLLRATHAVLIGTAGPVTVLAGADVLDDPRVR